MSSVGEIAKTAGLGLLKKAIGLVVIGALVIGGAYVYFKRQDASAPVAGDCLKVTGSSFDADYVALDCDDPDASFVVAAKNSKCDKLEIPFEFTFGKGGGTTMTTLCLGYNVAKGDCLMEGTMSTPGEKVGCKGDRAASALKVTKVETASAGGTCPKPVEGRIAYKSRDKLICLGPNRSS